MECADQHERCYRETSQPALLLPEKCVEPRLRDSLIDFRLGPTRRNPAKDLTVHKNRKSTLVGKKIWKRKHVEIALLQRLGRVLRGTPVKRRMPRLLLRPHNRVDRCSVRLLQEEQIAA